MGLNIKLDGEIPSLYLQDDTLMVSGWVLDGKDTNFFYLIEPNGEEIKMLQSTDSSGRFLYRVPLRQAGKYKMILTSGNAFETTTTLSFTTLPRSIISGKKTFASVAQDKITTLPISRQESLNLTPVDLMLLDENKYYELRMAQGSKTLSTFGMGGISLFPKDVE